MRWPHIFRPAVSHSMSGTLMTLIPMYLRGLFYLFYLLKSLALPCLRNGFLGSRNTGNSVSERSIFKISLNGGGGGECL